MKKMLQIAIKIQKSWLVFGLFAIASFFIGCDSKRVFEKNLPIPDGKWDFKDIKTFDVDISDTINLHNMYLNVRNKGNYPFSNCYLFVTTTYPNKNKSRDTVNCVLAAEDGEWLGSGIGDLFANQILYYKNFRFRNKGIYTFEIEQAMRQEVLEGITDVGLRIERTE